MILTFKVRHQQDFSKHLKQARQVAKFAIDNRDKLSSKYVSHFGLKSAISNQILRKYGKNKKCKTAKNIKITVPGQSIKVDKTTKTIKLPLLEETCFSYEFKQKFEKINQIEIDNKYFYISVEVLESEQFKPEGWIGVDRNTTGSCAVAACTKTSKVMMLGKQAKHVHQKYSRIRKKLQRQNKPRKLKTIKRRESNIIKDLNHKISRKIIDYAKANNCGIKLEDLTGIRKTKQAKSFKYALNSWGYYQLETFIEYKSQLAGVPVVKIEPAYTSQRCQMCGQLGQRNDKQFKCPYCGYTVHADVNASWNIAYSEQLLEGPKSKCGLKFDCIHFGMPYIQRLQLEKDGCKGNTDIPQSAMVMKHD